MRSLSRLSIALAMAITASASFASTGSKANYVTAFNDTQGLIVKVTIATDRGEETVKLHQHNKTIPSGQRERVALDKTAGCATIMKVTFDDGSTATQPVFDACTTGSINLVNG